VLDNETGRENLVDARFSYRFDTGGGAVNLFVNVNNLFDEDPEENLTVYSSNFSSGTGLGVTGENRGRRASVGVNVNFGEGGIGAR
jgi:outer membrane receptor protein involved in Fe transport